MLRVAQLVKAETVSGASDPDSDATNDAFLMLSPAKEQREASQVANPGTRKTASDFRQKCSPFLP